MGISSDKSTSFPSLPNTMCYLMLLITIYTALHTIWSFIVVLVAALCIVPTLTFVMETAKYIT
eukprot:scaffold348_cov151-Skeletonema_dohrnii-CCMP3373.AAC.3